MKYLTIIFSIILFSACGTPKQASAKTQTNNMPKALYINQDNVLIAYSAINRGSFLELKIENRKILVKKEQHGPDRISELSGEEWDILMNLLHGINLNTLSTLKAPSMKRAYDGAASAKLSITKDDMVYATPEFDHGNPNTEIEPLVSYILSLAKKVE